LKIFVKITRCFLPAIVALLMISCSTTPNTQIDPDERIAMARRMAQKHQYDEARKILDGLKFTIAGTTRNEEIQYLIAEIYYRQKNFLESDSAFAAYLAGYPDGQYAADALFYQALSKVKQSERHKLGFFTVRKVIPTDRDISFISDARYLFSDYLNKYSEGEFSDQAVYWLETLRSKVGEHELKIVSYYLKKNEHKAAIRRANKILAGDHPQEIKDRASSLLKSAKTRKD